MKFDELNKLFKGYFDVMEISQEDKRKRVDCAFFFYDAVWYVLTLIRLENERGSLESEESYIRSLDYRIRDALEENGLPYDEEYIPQMTRDVIETTFRHLEDTEDKENYFLSEKRAVLIAQNEANTVMNSVDYQTAKQSGKKYKEWMAELDNRTRPWHEEVNGVKIPIDDMFQVGTDSMRFPHDYVNGTAENLINCRCAVRYE